MLYTLTEDLRLQRDSLVLTVAHLPLERDASNECSRMVFIRVEVGMVYDTDFAWVKRRRPMTKVTVQGLSTMRTCIIPTQTCRIIYGLRHISPSCSDVPHWPSVTCPSLKSSWYKDRQRRLCPDTEQRRAENPGASDQSPKPPAKRS